jgi:subtilisin family serine protease
MPGCCEPPGLTYLKALLAGRQDIAVYPVDALEHDEPPPDFYFYRPGEILIPTEQEEQLQKVAAEAGIRITPLCGRKEHEKRGEPTKGPAGIMRYAVLARTDIQPVVGQLERAGLYVTPNHVLFGCPVWGLDPYGEPEPVPDELRPLSSEHQTGSIRVAVVDGGLPSEFDDNALLTGVEVPAPDELEAWPYSGPSPVLVFPQGHGSAVTGVVGQTSVSAQVMSYMVLDDDGVTDEWFLGHQVSLALAATPRVLNLSLGGYTRHDRPLLGLAHLKTETKDGNRPLVVAAAGNSDDARPFFPAADSWVIGVGAAEMIEHRDKAAPRRAPFSNWGPWVDVWAPGVKIHTAFEAHPYQPQSPVSPLRLFNGAAKWSGTSFAAPAITGRIADYLAEDPSLERAGVVVRLAGSSGGLTVNDKPYVPWPG